MKGTFRHILCGLILITLSHVNPVLAHLGDCFDAFCTSALPQKQPVQEKPLTVLDRYSHNPQDSEPGLNFTQGFVFHRGKIFESTGAPVLGPNHPTIMKQNGTSVLKSYRLQRFTESTLAPEPAVAGSVIAHFPPHYFGEGITIRGNQLLGLVWKEPSQSESLGQNLDSHPSKLFVWRLTENGSQAISEGTVALPSSIKEGWGLSSSSEFLYVTDGSNNIFELSVGKDKIPTDSPHHVLKVHRTISVVHPNTRQPINMLNAIQYVERGGRRYLFANVWLTQNIIEIDLDVNSVVGIYRLDPEHVSKNFVWRSDHKTDDVMNGIAYVPEDDTFLITGKNWPHIFKVRMGQNEGF